MGDEVEWEQGSESVALHGVDEGTRNYDPFGYCIVELFETELKSDKSSYIPLRKIANGRFSTVFLCRDIKMKRYVAVKICQAGLKLEISKDEVTILEEISKNCKSLPDNGGIVQLLDSFIYEESIPGSFQSCPKEYFCIVFELLGHSVYRLLTRYTPNINYNKAIPMPIVKTIALNLLESVHNLHHVAKIIHTDIKPENISMVYYLPLISENSGYDLDELIFGPQSQEIFDAKLATPAICVNYYDYKMESQHVKTELRQFIMREAYRRGINTWPEAKREMMDWTDYKEEFAEFVRIRGSAVADASVSCYYIDGMNIFNLPNLIATAESVFRLETLPLNYQQEEEIEQLIKGQNGRITASLYDARDVIASYSIDGLQKNCMPSKCVYEIPNDRQYDAKSRLFIAGNKIKYAISEVEALHQELRSTLCKCCVEREICDTKDYHSIIKSAEHGLHSRIQLKALVDRTRSQARADAPNIDCEQPLIIPSVNNQNRYKCFALTSKTQKIYPTLISYYSKKQLIPFCPEMFKIKLVDLGNACYLNHRFSSVIETINYRAPEIIVGVEDYTYKVDEFSVGCVIFELLTGNVLFNPRLNDEYDPLYHLEQIVQTVGEDGLDWLLSHCARESLLQLDNSGKESFKFAGKLQFRSVATELVNDYGFTKEVAVSVEELILPLLRLNPEKRADCADLISNSWLNNLGSGDFLIGYGGRHETGELEQSG